MRIKFTKSVIANIDGKSVKCSHGQEMELFGESADNLIRGGYAYEVKPERKPEPKPEPEPEQIEQPTRRDVTTKRPSRGK